MADAEKLLLSGMAALERGSEAEARNLYVEAREAAGSGEFPGVTDPDALYFAGLACGQLAEDPFPIMKRAVRAYEARDVPSLRGARAYETLGYFLQSSGDSLRAGEAMMRAQGMYSRLYGYSSHESNAAYNAGVSFQLGEDYERSLAAFDLAKSVSDVLPGFDLGHAIIELSRSDVLLRVGRSVEAEEGFRLAVSEFSSVPGNELLILEARFGVGRALVAQERYEEGVKELYDVANNTAEIAETHFRMGTDESALVGYNAAETSARAHHQLAVGYAQLGRLHDAYTAMNIAASSYDAMEDVFGAAHCRGLVGDICAESGDIMGARKNFTLAIEMLEKAEDEALGYGLPPAAAQDLEEFRAKLKAVSG
ncbi:hypothetical protein CJ184_003400 [Actinotignum urinale]|uniref:Tetratricopeptide repeat protein n=1 Tax=Actinotignum urinale TaxID=190146 RepID=A0AAW9HVP1_9ACTO|nr:hypothetical protein [Actinotignum urinale]MDY5154407.1 hypothetical protein [Actinotignum urinale]WIK59696.1 hypothetical protein CJ184_003400 [Actinotignum urinale]